MIQEFVDMFMNGKEALAKKYAENAPDSYEAIVKDVVEIIENNYLETDKWESHPTVERIHKIDDGDYQGTLLFVIATSGYQPDDYWYVKVGYGSCSGCDTFDAIQSSYGYNEKPSEQAVQDYCTLALHIVQGLRPMQDKG